MWEVVQLACILLAFLRGFDGLAFGLWSDVAGNAEGAGWLINDGSVMRRGHENCREKERHRDWELRNEVNTSVSEGRLQTVVHA